MKGIRFYEELKGRDSTSNVIASLHGNGIFYSSSGNPKMSIPCYEAIASLFETPNSPVASTSVAVEYLQEYCKRVSEKKARELHPELFKRLDD